MDSRWFKEDRSLDPASQQEAIEESKKALKSSTLITRRLTMILQEEIEKTYQSEEIIDHPNYELLIANSAGRRKAFRDMLKLINFK